MSVFDDYLPWTVSRVNQISKEELDTLMMPANGVKQDQKSTISNLMLLLFKKIHGELDLSKYMNRHKVVHWYETLGKDIFRIDELVKNRSNENHGDYIAPSEPGINLIGYARSISGLGEDIRNLAKVLSKTSIPFCIICLGHPSNSPQFRRVMNETNEPKFNTSIFLVNFFEFDKISSAYRDLKQSFGQIILQSPWELPKLLSRWSNSLQNVDQFWAISQFVKTAHLDFGLANVHYMPPILDTELVSEKQTIPRQKKCFTLLYIFDAASYLKRKNPDALIDSFQKAFSPNENVKLILKVNSSIFNDNFVLLKNKCLSDPRIKLDTNNYSKIALNELIQSCDCYVSLHRSEGFGRTIAEACLQFKPIVATNWSGNTDIVPDDYPMMVNFNLISLSSEDYPGGDGQSWADVDVEMASKLLRKVAALTEEQREHLGMTCQQYVKSHFGIENVVNHYQQRIEKSIDKDSVQC